MGLQPIHSAGKMHAWRQDNSQKAAHKKLKRGQIGQRSRNSKQRREIN
jgi:hypothetical protein